jgi:uncharacterized phage protein gp47/JayE
MFQTKNFLSIVASMINYMRGATQKITDFNPGAIARTLIEAPAIEMDELYQQMVNGLTAAIPVATYNSFNFPALAPQGASGPIRVVITAEPAAVLIPAGTVFSRPDGIVTYASLTDIIIASGSTYGDVPVTATTTGSVTNTPASTQFTAAPAITGFVSASNLTAFFNGLDAESDDQRQTRFQEYISTLQRSTVQAILYGAKTAKLYDANGNVTEQVKLAQLIEPWKTDPTQPVGLINIYVHNGVGSTSGALVALALQIVQGYVDGNGNNVPGYKAAGTHTTMAAATELPVNFAAVLTAAPGYDHATLVAGATDAVAGYILALDEGGTCLFWDLNTIVTSIEGVANFVISTPLDDVTSTLAQKLMPGTIAIT